MSNEDRWVSIDEAAKIVGVCRRTIYNWIEQGLLQTRKIASGRQRIKVSSLWRTEDGKTDWYRKELS